MCPRVSQKVRGRAPNLDDLIVIVVLSRKYKLKFDEGPRKSHDPADFPKGVVSAWAATTTDPAGQSGGAAPENDGVNAAAAKETAAAAAEQKKKEEEASAAKFLQSLGGASSS